MSEPNRYWVCWDGVTWREITLHEWIEWEKALGFHGHGPFGNTAATEGFNTGTIKGQTWSPFEE